MGRPMWFDDQVISNGRDGATEDGITKDTGVAVRYCESCLDPALSVEEQTANPCMPGRRKVWRLVGEFPTDFRRSACKYCLGLKSERPTKPTKGEKFSHYNEYVKECHRIKDELEELARMRRDLMNRKSALLARKREVDTAYRDGIKGNC